jgi:hypothetical protein
LAAAALAIAAFVQSAHAQSRTDLPAYASGRGRVCCRPPPLVSQTHVPDAVYEQAKAQFSDEELVKLTLLIASINAWNRFAIPSARFIP